MISPSIRSEVKGFALVRLFVFGAALTALTGCKPLPASKPEALFTPEEARGAQVYHEYCAQCHYPTTTRGLKGPGLQALTKVKAMPSGAPPSDEADHSDHPARTWHDAGNPRRRRGSAIPAGLSAHAMSIEPKEMLQDAPDAGGAGKGCHSAARNGGHRALHAGAGGCGQLWPWSAGTYRDSLLALVPFFVVASFGLLRMFRWAWRLRSPRFFC